MTCDPKVATLDADACNALNTKTTDCTQLYQCDKASGVCKIGPRDYDRDGDPDKMCGGNDCNDYDSSINSLNKLCGCDQKMLGQPCQVGVGACITNATYSCKDGSLFCALPSPPVPNPDYMKMPYTNGSWDWDCNGKPDMMCPDVNGALAVCPTANCGGTMFNVNSTADQVNSACSAYCAPYKYMLGSDTCTRDKTFLCDQSCGTPVYYCHCSPGSASLSGYPCNGTAMPASTSVRCK